MQWFGVLREHTSHRPPRHKKTGPGRTVQDDSKMTLARRRELESAACHADPCCDIRVKNLRARVKPHWPFTWAGPQPPWNQYCEWPAQYYIQQGKHIHFRHYYLDTRLFPAKCGLGSHVLCNTTTPKLLLPQLWKEPAHSMLTS